MQKYKAYKDSGVEWLGEIPEHWDLVRLKYRAKVKKGILPKRTTQDSQYPPYMTMEYLRGGKAEIYVEDKNAVIIESDEILLLWDGSNAGEFLSSRKGVISSTVAHLQFNNVLKNYIFYYCKVLERVLRLNTVGMGIPHVNGGVLSNLILSIPPLPEQTAIANYLDKKTTKIDTAIAQKEKLITLLKERKQILIQNAVTKGLDPNVKLKDSGVEWIGEIPEHWEVSKLKNIVQNISDVDHYMPDTVEDGVSYLMTGDLKEFVSQVDFENCKKVSRKDYNKLSKKIRNEVGDIIFARYATIGTCCYVDLQKEFVVSYSCVTIKPSLSKLLGIFLYYYLKSNSFSIEIKNQINTNTQGNVGVNDLKQVRIVNPSISEQQEIAKYIETESQKIDKAIGLQQQQIEKLQEYKRVLIDSCVTGKVKVI